MISESEIQFYKSIINELNVVFDVGCQHDNIFDELKPGIEVHLFDPVKSIRLLDKIKGKNNITYNNIALGSKRTTMPFHIAYGSFLHLQDKKFTDQHETLVDVDTGLNYCKRKNIQQIDFLKIDTEGFDFEVIKGFWYMIKNIRYVQFEDWSKELTDDIIQYLSPKKIIELDGKPKNYVAVL